MTNEAPAPVVDSEQLAKRVQMFVDVRDKLDAMKDDFETRCKPLKEAKDLLEGWIMQFLATSGTQSVKTKAGVTAYLSSRASASLADPDAFMRHVIGSGAFELLDRKANATAVEAFIKENGEAPPGVNFARIRTLGVRKGRKPNG